jgi:hypothetical protein
MKLSRTDVSGDSPRTWLKGTVVLVLVLAVSAPATAKTGVQAPTPMRGNVATLLDNGKGATLGCASALDPNKLPRLACALVILDNGGYEGIVDKTLWVEIRRQRLLVHREGTPAPIFTASEPKGAVGGTFTTGRPQEARRFEPKQRYTYSGTRVGCTLRAGGRAVICLVRDKAFRARPGTYGFTIGFSSVQVLRVGPARHTTVVFSRND